MDKISIRDLTVRCIIGLEEHERRERQDVLINVDVWADLSDAIEHDDVKRGLDYKQLNKQIIKLAEDSSYFLVERLAEEIARCCLSFERVYGVRVSVEKPGALRFARSVGVEIYRERE